MNVITFKKDGETWACATDCAALAAYGENEREALSALEENVYIYCNWLGCPLPKDLGVKVVKRSEAFSAAAFSPLGNKELKRAKERALQAAFSLKAFSESFDMTEEERDILNAYLAFSDDICSPYGEGLIGGVSALVSSDDEKLGEKAMCLSAHAFLAAQKLYDRVSKRGIKFTDSFTFGL